MERIIDTTVLTITAHHMTLTSQYLPHLLILCSHHDKLAAAETRLISLSKIIKYIYYTRLFQNTSIFLRDKDIGKFIWFCNRIIHKRC